MDMTSRKSLNGHDIQEIAQIVCTCQIGSIHPDVCVCAGLFDTAASQSEVCAELSRAMAMSQHGIHAILLVLTTSSRFTAEEVACLNYLRSACGGQLLRHCILVFTHGDSLEEEETPLDEFLRNCPESLQVHAM